MSAFRTITLNFPTNTDGHLTGQVRNFGEDIYRHIERPGLGDAGGLAVIDRATDGLVIVVKHRRKIGTVRKLVAQILKDHLLQDRCDVSFS